jgi:hypothetical protein
MNQTDDAVLELIFNPGKYFILYISSRTCISIFHNGNLFTDDMSLSGLTFIEAQGVGFEAVAQSVQDNPGKKMR